MRSPILVIHVSRFIWGDRGMDWKKLLGALRASVDEDLRLRNAYLAAENRLLCQQLPGRVPLSDGDRHALAENQCGQIHGGEVSLQESQAVIAHVEGLSHQSCPRHRGLRLFHGSNCELPSALRVHLAGSRAPAYRVYEYHRAFLSAVDGPTGCRSVSLGTVPRYLLRDRDAIDSTASTIESATWTWKKSELCHDRLGKIPIASE
jgi:hypothetical protein